MPYSPTSADRPKFLLVDDQEDNLASLEDCLDHCDVEMLKATSGEEALKLGEQHDFALAIIDVQMPLMDGFAVLEALRHDPRTAPVPVVMLSALTFEEIEARCVELGAAAYVRKPFQADALLGALRVVLRDPVPVPGVQNSDGA